MQDMGERRSLATSAAGDGRTLYVCGGTTSDVLSSVEKLEFRGMPSAATGIWRWAPPMSCARICPAAVCAGGYLYVIGGTDSSRSLSTVERLKLRPSTSGFSRTASWEMLPPMRQARVGAAVASTSTGLICVCGGCTLGGHHQTANLHHNSGEYFDPAVGLWAALPNMKHSRSYAGVAVMAGRLYIIGGQSNLKTHLEDGESLDLTTLTWERVPSMMQARLFCCPVVVRR